MIAGCRVRCQTTSSAPLTATLNPTRCCSCFRAWNFEKDFMLEPGDHVVSQVLPLVTVIQIKGKNITLSPTPNARCDLAFGSRNAHVRGGLPAPGPNVRASHRERAKPLSEPRRHDAAKCEPSDPGSPTDPRGRGRGRGCPALDRTERPTASVFQETSACHPGELTEHLLLFRRG